MLESNERERKAKKERCEKINDQGATDAGDILADVGSADGRYRREVDVKKVPALSRNEGMREAWDSKNKE